MTHWGEVKPCLWWREFQICQPQGTKLVSFSSALPRRALRSPWSTFCCILFLVRGYFFSADFFKQPGTSCLKRQYWEITFGLHNMYVKRRYIFSLDYFCQYLISESIVQPRVAIKYLVLMWLPDLSVSPLFKVRKPMLTTYPASLANTVWILALPLF